MPRGGGDRLLLQVAVQISRHAQLGVAEQHRHFDDQPVVQLDLASPVAKALRVHAATGRSSAGQRRRLISESPLAVHAWRNDSLRAQRCRRRA